MNNLTCLLALTGVVPGVCDAEAGETDTLVHDGKNPNGATAGVSSGLSVRAIRSVMAELCSALRSALDDERDTAEESLLRAAEALQELREGDAARAQRGPGGLAPWQIRQVTNYVEGHLEQRIMNEDLAALVQLNLAHFGRAFRESFGEPPHEYVIRRRIERAQGLMLSTDAPLNEIALDCGLSDQSHLSRLFRRIAGESPRAWRRARLGERRDPL